MSFPPKRLLTSIISRKHHVFPLCDTLIMLLLILLILFGLINLATPPYLIYLYGCIMCLISRYTIGFPWTMSKSSNQDGPPTLFSCSLLAPFTFLGINYILITLKKLNLSYEVNYYYFLIKHLGFINQTTTISKNTNITWAKTQACTQIKREKITWIARVIEFE